MNKDTVPRLSPSDLTIVGIGGSLRARSSSRAALRTALAGAEAQGANTIMFDLRELALPFFQPGLDELPENAARLLDACQKADGLIWSSPMYNGTVSGPMKNALDWLYVLGGREPPYLTDKVIGLVSVAGGTQGLQVVNTLEYAVRALRAWAVPLVVPIPFGPDAFDGNGVPSMPTWARS
jgi:FMN reductase